MASTCEIRTKTTGEFSTNFNKLKEFFNENNYENLGERALEDAPLTQASKAYSYMHSPKFLSWFGNWPEIYKQKGVVASSLINEQGEPRLFEFNNYLYFKNHRGDILPVTAFRFAGLPIPMVESMTNIIVHAIAQQNQFFDFERIEERRFSISQIINQVFAQIGKTDNREVLINLNKAKVYADEFREEVERRLLALKLNVEEQEDAITEEGEEDQIDPLNIKDSVTKNSKDKATANTKLFLNFAVPKVIKEGGKEKLLVDPYFKQPMYESFGSVWQMLEPLLANIQDNFDVDGKSRLQVMLEKIDALATIRPSLKRLKTSIQQASPTQQKQIVIAFTKSRIHFLNTLYTIDFDEVQITESGKKAILPVGYTFKVHRADTNAPDRIIANAWGDNFYNSNLVEKEGKEDTDNNLADVAALKDIQQQFESIRTNMSKELKGKGASAIKLDHYNKLTNILAKIGIDIKDTEFFNYFNDQKGKTYTEKFLNGVGAMQRIFDTVVEQAEGKKTRGKTGNFVNPLKEQSVTFELAASKAMVSPVIGENTVLGREGTYWVYSLPSYLTMTFDRIKSGDLSYLQTLAKLPYFRNSYIIKQALASSEFRENLTLERFLTIKQERAGQKGEDTKTINFFADFVANLNRVLAGVLPSDKMRLNMLTPADKPKMEILTGLPMIRTQLDKGLSGDEDPNINVIAVDRIVGYVKDELELLRDLMVNGTDNVHANNNIYAEKIADRRTMFILPELQFGLGHPLEKDLYDEKGVPRDPNNPEVTKKLNKYVREALIEKFKAVRRKMETYGVAQSPKIFDSAIRKEYEKKLGDPELVFDNMLADYIINSMVGNIEMTKFGTGSPIFYKKNDFFKRVPETYTDGILLALEDSSQIDFRVAIIDSIEVSDDNVLSDQNIERIQKLYKEQYGITRSKEWVEKTMGLYKKSNIADAQAWITPERWKFIMQGLGRWNTKYDVVYDKMINGGALTKEEFKLAAQPLKGVHYQLNERGVPVYLKYSQAVLIPELVRGTDLDKLLTAMRNSNIDEVVTRDGIKAGFNNPLAIHEGARIMKTPQFKDEHILTLDNRYWKLQQDLPVKGIKQGALASQIQKNILANIVRDGDYILDGKPIKGEDLVKELFGTMNNILDEQFGSMLQELGIKVDEDGLLLFETLNKDKFKEIVLEQLQGRGEAYYMLDAIKNDIDFNLVPSLRRTIQNVMASYFRKKLIKINVNQGAMIQVSNFGTHTLNTKQKKGIKWLTDDTNLKSPVLDENGRVTAGQILMPSWLIEEHIPNYRELSKEKLLSMIDKRMFEIIGYRIPNQGMASIDRLEVVGILPASAGDEVVVYTGLTTKTGSDFDIDKMYALFPHMKVIKEGDAKIIDDVLKAFNVKGNRAKSLLREEGIKVSSQSPLTELKSLLLEYYRGGIAFSKNHTEEDQKIIKAIEKALKDKSAKRIDYLDSSGNNKYARSNRLLEIYASILSDGKSYIDLMEPLDRSTELIKQDINNLHGEQQAYEAFEMFDPIKQIEIKHDLSGGKTGVGSNANQLVHHPLAQLSDLFFMGKFFPVDKINTVEEGGYDRGSLAGIYDANNELRITQSMSGTLSGFVDIAKDAWVSRGNYKQSLLPTIFMMYRMGLSYKYINRFVGQPILKKYSELQSYVSPFYNIRDAYKFRSEEEVGDIDTAMFVEFPLDDEQILEYANANNLDDYLDSKYNGRSHEDVLEGQITGKDPIDPILQHLLYDKFSMIKGGPAKALSELIQSTKFDVNGAGNTIAKQIVARNKIIKAMFSSAFGSEGLAKMYAADTPLGKRARNGIEALLAINAQFYYEADPAIMTMLNELSIILTGDVLLDDEFAETLVNAMYPLLFSNATALRHENVQSLFMGPDRLAKQLAPLKRKYPENAFLRALSNRRGVVNGYELLEMNTIRTMTADERSNIVRDWEKLLVQKETSEFANNMVKLAYYQSNFNMGLGNFHELIPPTWFTANGVIVDIKGMIEELRGRTSAMAPGASGPIDFTKSYSPVDFAINIIANNYDKDTLVPTLSKSGITKALGSVPHPNQKIVEVEMPLHRNKYPRVFKYKRGQKGLPRVYVAIAEKVFSRRMPDGSKTMYKKIMYERINLAGYKSPFGDSVYEPDYRGFSSFEPYTETKQNNVVPSPEWAVVHIFNLKPLPENASEEDKYEYNEAAGIAIGTWEKLSTLEKHKQYKNWLAHYTHNWKEPFVPKGGYKESVLNNESLDSIIEKIYVSLQEENALDSIGETIDVQIQAVQDFLEAEFQAGMREEEEHLELVRQLNSINTIQGLGEFRRKYCES